jgi:hypothetical protein
LHWNWRLKRKVAEANSEKSLENIRETLAQMNWNKKRRLQSPSTTRRKILVVIQKKKFHSELAVGAGKIIIGTSCLHCEARHKVFPDSYKTSLKGNFISLWHQFGIMLQFTINVSKSVRLDNSNQS